MRIVSRLCSLLLVFLTPLLMGAESAHEVVGATPALSFLINPNIAYLLILLAFYGLFFELANPGGVFPGVIGIIALLLAIYALRLMPINYNGLLLIFVGFVFMLIEVYVSSFGIIGVGGVIAFILGSIMLFNVHDSPYHLSWPFIAVTGIITLIFFLMVLGLVWKSQKKAVVTGKEGFIGSEGIVLSKLNDQLIVQVKGEIWKATSTHPLTVGEKIKVMRAHGLVLVVTPLLLQQRKNSGE